MPTPLGHALGGLAAGWAVAGPARDRYGIIQQSLWLALFGAAADLDLLVGRHRAESHSLGAAVLVATLAAWPLARAGVIADGRARTWLAVVAAWATHPLLDALAVDNGPPIGIMAFWPVSTGHVQTGWAVFLPVLREYWVARALKYDLWAALRETAILVPVCAAVWWLRRERAG